MNDVGFKSWLKQYSHDMTCPALVMGILNITPDSFSDGGRYLAPKDALSRAMVMIEQGVDIIDIGGESSRPGSSPISVDEELDRVIPVLQLIRQHTDCCISIDTYKPEVMGPAIEYGANLINDIYALQQPGAAEIVIKHQIPVCLMHMRGVPQTMNDSIHSEIDMVCDVKAFFTHKIEHLINLGLSSECIILDPGIGFGKNLLQNMSLISNLAELKCFNLPILLGASNKRFIGEVLGGEPFNRGTGTQVSQLLGYMKGAKILRTHDVATTKQSLMMAHAILNTEKH